MGEVLFIFGGKSTALEINEVVTTYSSSKYDRVLLVVPDDSGIEENHNYILHKDLSRFTHSNSCKYIVGFTDIKGREGIQKKMNAMKVEPVNVIHPSSIISKAVCLGVGNYIAAGSIVSHNVKILDHCIINYNVIIGHDSLIKTNSILSPGSRISGNVVVGERVFIGTNSFIFQGNSVGNDCIVDAMTYVKNDLDDNYICSSRTYKKVKRVI